MEPLVADAEVVTDLVQDGDPDLLQQVVPRRAVAGERAAEDVDVVRQVAQPVARVAGGEGDTDIQPEQAGDATGRRLVLDRDRDVLQPVEQLLRDQVQRVGGRLLELLPGHRDGHGSAPFGWWPAPSRR